MHECVRRSAVIGAGMAGLAAAAVLVKHGRDVTVLEKSRGPGGRIATRRVEKWTFDHGATAIRVADLDDELRADIAVEWKARRLRLGLDNRPLMPKLVSRMVGVPGMSGLVDQFAPPTRLLCGVRAERLVRDGKAYRILDTDGGSHGPFDELVISVPAPQAAELLADDEKLEPFREFLASKVPYCCRWALMLGWRAPAVDLGWDLVEGIDESLPVITMTREATKPGRPTLEAMVVHAGVDWSTPRIDHAPETVAPLLLEAARSLVGPARWPRGEPAYVVAHRWRLAQPEIGCPQRSLMPKGERIVFCGDWFGEGTVGVAKRSGMDAAGVLLHTKPSE